MINRRYFMALAGGVVLYGTAASFLKGTPVFGTSPPRPSNFPVTLTDAEWRARLSPEAYRILRGHGTERSGTSALNHEKRDGIYHCAGCDHPLFSSAHKFDSGTGWPSFFQPLNGQAIGTAKDNTLFTARTEVHCANCGGHLGHMFDDGPAPTGQRYCMNGAAMRFTPGEPGV